MRPFTRTLLCLGALSCTKTPADFSEVPLAEGHVNQLSALSADDIWGVSRPDVFHFDGKQWVSAGSVGAEHIAAVARDDVWGVGRGGSWFHFDGKAWSNGRVPQVAQKYLDFWGVVAWPGEAWATAGQEGTYSRHSGGEWSQVQVPELGTWELKRIAAIGRHVWVALEKSHGEPGKRTFEAALGHFDGSTWNVVDNPPGLQIRGSAPDDVWIVMGKPRHFDGKRWTETLLPEGSVPYDLYARSKTEAYIVGKKGLALKWDGKGWTELYSGTRRDLFTVIGGAEGPIWVGGLDKKMLRYPK